jgi:hypothetical protein
MVSHFSGNYIGGAYAFLPKPFDDEAFLALVHDALGEEI